MTNGVRGDNCKIVVVSRSRHDLQTCYCARVFIDGGSAYTRVGFTSDGGPGYTMVSKVGENGLWLERKTPS